MSALEYYDTLDEELAFFEFLYPRNLTCSTMRFYRELDPLYGLDLFYRYDKLRYPCMLGTNRVHVFAKPKNFWIREDQEYWECRKATMLEF